MSCLNYIDFRSKYTFEEVEETLMKGASGKVFITENRKYAIKRQKISPQAITEITMLSQIVHPNIIKIIDVCFHQTNIYFSMLAGKLVGQAFVDGDMTIQQIVSDILSAVHFLHLIGIAHRDIKHTNCVMVKHRGENIVCLIDFGLAYFCDRYSFRQIDSSKDKIERFEGYAMSGIAFTNQFKDPEYNNSDLNYLKSELYSIAQTAAVLMMAVEEGNRIMTLGVYRQYYRDFSLLIDDPDMVNLLEEMQKFVEDRKTTGELVSDNVSVMKERVSIGDFIVVPNAVRRLSILTLRKITMVCGRNARASFLAASILSKLQSPEYDDEDININIACYIACSLTYRDTRSIPISGEGLCKFYNLFSLNGKKGLFFGETLYDELVSGEQVYSAYYSLSRVEKKNGRNFPYQNLVPKKTIPEIEIALESSSPFEGEELSETGYYYSDTTTYITTIDEMLKKLEKVWSMSVSDWEGINEFHETEEENKKAYDGFDKVIHTIICCRQALKFLSLNQSLTILGMLRYNARASKTTRLLEILGVKEYERLSNEEISTLIGDRSVFA